MNNKLGNYIKLMRPHQWVKNVFIFLPLFFSFRMMETSLLFLALWAFAGFCLISSSVYIINDWNDIEADRKHPEKCKRPMAAGTVGKNEVLMLSFVLLLGSIFIFALVLHSTQLLALVLFYFVLNIGYSFKLKHIPIVDISIVAIGFVIRVFVGGIATGIPVSRWLVIMTFLVALFFVLGKRHDDVLILENTGKKTRKNIDGYNIAFLNIAITIVTTIIIIAYIMYTFSDEIVAQNGGNLYLTSFFVIVGLFRYLQIIFVEGKSGNPTKTVVKDKFICIVVVLWIISFIVISRYFK